jgi:hypothetical protein
LIQPSESAVSPIKPASPERFSDEEIQMTLEMPSDPFGVPGGFFVFPDPQEEVSPLGDAYLLPDPNQDFDFVMDFEADLDFGFEVVRDEVFEDTRKDEPPIVVEVNSSSSLVVPVSTFAPRMPTILEENEQEEEGGEEENGDVTITPSEAQKALLPPDRFACPPSVPQPAGAVDASQDISFGPLETPRPGGEFHFPFV